MHVAAYTESSFFGGGEKALAILLAGLDQTIDLTVIGPHPEIVEAVAASRPDATVQIVKGVKNRHDTVGIAAQLGAMRKLRPDILHANGNAWSCQYALAAGVLTRGVRTLLANHSLTPHDRRSQVWLNRQKLRHVDAITAVSTDVALGVEEIGRLPAGTVQVIPNGVPDVPVTPLPRRVAGPIIGSVGRLSPEKGHDVLLRALKSLPNVTAILIGDGPERGRLEQLAQDLRLGGQLIMTGWQSDPLPWLPTFDVFVLPSRLEALPLAAIEAMLASRPVVASNIGGVPEVVGDGETGLLVQPDDAPALAAALRSLLADAPRRRRMGARGREVAKQEFDPSKMVLAYESRYRDLLDHTLHGPPAARTHHSR